MRVPVDAKKVLQKTCCSLVALCASLASAHGQMYDITPSVGVRLGGTVDLEQSSGPNFQAHFPDSLSYGVAGGVRFNGDDCEGCNLIEFRWMRQDTHLFVKQDPLAPTPYSTASFRPPVTLNHYLGDFTHEWTVPDAPFIKPFITGTLGAVHFSTPASGATRFAFGIGAGFEVFPARHWGFRLHAEYLPIVMHAELQTLVCTTGCIVILNGGVMNQFNVSIGPTFRF